MTIFQATITLFYLFLYLMVGISYYNISKAIERLSNPENYHKKIEASKRIEAARLSFIVAFFLSITLFPLVVIVDFIKVVSYNFKLITK